MRISDFNKLRSVISNYGYFGFYVFIALSFLNMILEIIGIGLIIPLISSFFNNSNYLNSSEFSILKNISFYLSAYSTNQIILLIFIIFFLKTVLIILITFARNKFIFRLQENISNNILKGFMSMNYSKYSLTKQSELINTIVIETSVFCGNVVFALITIIIEAILLIGIVLMLLTINFKSLFFIFLIYLIYYFLWGTFTKKIITKLGYTRQKAEEDRTSILNEVFDSFKEIKIFKAKDYFFKRFYIYNKLKSQISTIMDTFSQSSRYLLEFISVVSILIIIIYFQSKMSNVELISILGLFGVASIRIMPSVHKLVSAVDGFRFGTSTIDIIYSYHLNLIKENETSKYYFAPPWSDRDINNLRNEFPKPIFHINKSDQFKGNKFLEKITGNENNKFICLIVRDKSYLQTTYPQDSNWEYHNYRDHNIDDFIPLIKKLNQNNFHVFRMGKTAEKEISYQDKMFIDYPFLSEKSDFLDFFLASRCEFCISTSLGFDALPVMFRKPIFYTDLTPLNTIYTGVNNSINTLSLYYSKNENRYLTIQELFDREIYNFFDGTLFKQNNVEIIKTSPQSKVRYLSEFISRINLNYKETDEEKHLQNKFWDLFIRNISKKNGEIIHGNISTKISTQFLKDNKDKLGL